MHDDHDEDTVGPARIADPLPPIDQIADVISAFGLRYGATSQSLRPPFPVRGALRPISEQAHLHRLPYAVSLFYRFATVPVEPHAREFYSQGRVG